MHYWLCNSVIDLCIYVGRAGECAVEVSEVLSCLEFLSFHCDSGFRVDAVGSWLEHHFCLSYSDGEAKVIAGCGAAVHILLCLLLTAGI